MTASKYLSMNVLLNESKKMMESNRIIECINENKLSTITDHQIILTIFIHFIIITNLPYTANRSRYTTHTPFLIKSSEELPCMTLQLRSAI